MLVVALAVALPSLQVGMHVDDYVQWAIVSGAPAVHDLYPSRLDLFAFVNGDPEHTRRLIDRGILPWWTFERVKLAFWRPVASLTHGFDYTVWPHRPVLMHAQSLAWFGALIFAAALMYRQIMAPTWAAGAAALLYSFDNTHAVGVAWLANRNILLATLFGTLTLWAHDRWRRSGWRVGAFLGPGFFAMGLLSAEAAVATGAYLAAHAFFLDTGGLRNRLIAILPYIGIGAGWQILYQWLGYGTFGASPAYISPALEPLRFLMALAVNPPILLLAQWAGVSAESYYLLTPTMALARWLLALLGVTVFALVLLPLLKRDPVARFWGVGHLLALVPIAATPLSDRYLFFVGLGAMGLLARFLCGLIDQESWRPGLSLWRLSAVVFASLLIAGRLVVAPVQLVQTFTTVAQLGTLVERSSETLAADPGGRQQRVVVVNVPDASFVGYSVFIRAAKGQPVAPHTLLLTSTPGPVQLSRLDARTLAIRPHGPQVLMFRPVEHPIAVNDQVRLDGVTIQVTALTSDGRPAEARVGFDVDLEAPSLRWLQWQWVDGGGRYVPLTPPGIDQTIDVR
jgi:hypothetical protein